MTGTARQPSRSILSLRAILPKALVAIAFPMVVFGCGGPANDGATAPRAPVAQATPESPPAREANPQNDAPANVGAPNIAGANVGAPSTTQGWPFAPAPTADEQKSLLERLAKDPGPIKTNWTPPGRTERYGHAEGLIGAPYDKVKARIGDYARYHELAGPKFKKVNVVDKQASGTDLYFNLPIMRGLVTIWYVTRFAPARPGAGGDVVEGTFVKGNIKSMHLVFTLRPGPDPKNTVLICDLNLAITLPAPQAALDEELRDACGDAVAAVRARTTTP